MSIKQKVNETNPEVTYAYLKSLHTFIYMGLHLRLLSGFYTFWFGSTLLLKTIVCNSFPHSYWQHSKPHTKGFLFLFFLNLGTVDLNSTGLNYSYHLICSLCLIRCQTCKVKKLGFKWLILWNCLSLFLFSESFISSFIFEAEIAIPVFQLH